MKRDAFRDMVAIVSGASSGIGRTLAGDTVFLSRLPARQDNLGQDGINVMKLEFVESFIQWQGGLFAYGTFVAIFYSIRREWARQNHHGNPDRTHTFRKEDSHV